MDKVIESFAGKVAKWLISSERIPREKEDVYQYAALIAIQSAINIIAMLLIGLLGGKFFENICFFIAFKFLRKFSGGLHSAKFSICFLISVVSNILVVLSVYLFEHYNLFWLMMLLEILSLILVFIFAPVSNKNKSITQRESKAYKVIACVISVALVVVSLFLAKYCLKWIFPIGLAMVLNSLLIIVEKVKSIPSFANSKK